MAKSLPTGKRIILVIPLKIVTKRLVMQRLEFFHHRYEISPGYKKIKQLIDSTFTHLGYDPKNTSLAYWEGDQQHLEIISLKM